MQFKHNGQPKQTRRIKLLALGIALLLSFASTAFSVDLLDLLLSGADGRPLTANEGVGIKVTQFFPTGPDSHSQIFVYDTPGGNPHILEYRAAQMPNGNTTHWLQGVQREITNPGTRSVVYEAPMTPQQARSAVSAFQALGPAEGPGYVLPSKATPANLAAGSAANPSEFLCCQTATARIVPHLENAAGLGVPAAPPKPVPLVGNGGLGTTLASGAAGLGVGAVTQYGTSQALQAAGVQAPESNVMAIPVSTAAGVVAGDVVAGTLGTAATGSALATVPVVGGVAVVTETTRARAEIQTEHAKILDGSGNQIIQVKNLRDQRIRDRFAAGEINEQEKQKLLQQSAESATRELEEDRKTAQGIADTNSNIFTAIGGTFSDACSYWLGN